MFFSITFVKNWRGQRAANIILRPFGVEVTEFAIPAKHHRYLIVKPKMTPDGIPQMSMTWPNRIMSASRPPVWWRSLRSRQSWIAAHSDILIIGSATAILAGSR